MTATHWTHYHWPAGRYYLTGDCDSPDTLSLACWETLPGWWLRLTGHTILSPLGDITWLVTATHWHTITGPLGDITWLVTATHRTHYHWPAGRYTWLVTATHCTHYHWPAGRYYLAGDCDSPVHTITGQLIDITWLVTATHRTHYHWPAGRYYLTGDCDSLDTLSLARWARYYLAGDCDSLYTLSLARCEIWLGWWLRLTGHTITGPLVDITWLVTATHWTCAL